MMFRSIPIFTVVLAFAIIFQETASAQNGRANGNASQAVLTIQVQVVPIAMMPKPIASQGNQEISYSIPVAPVRLSVTESKQLLNVSNDSGKVERRVVNIITVVAD